VRESISWICSNESLQVVEYGFCQTFVCTHVQLAWNVKACLYWFIIQGQQTIYNCLSKTDLIVKQDFKELNFILITNKLQGNFQLQQAFYFYAAVYACWFLKLHVNCPRFWSATPTEVFLLSADEVSVIRNSLNWHF